MQPSKSSPESQPDVAAPARPSTDSSDYAERLARLQTAGWKRVVDVQRPYRWNLRRLELGFALDVGCGLGRNLAHLDGNAVGVDHNRDSVAAARGRGLRAYTPDEFLESAYAVADTFDSMLSAHVVEHMPSADAAALLACYLPYVKPGGRLVLITPQESGFRSDPTHCEFVDFAALERLAVGLGLVVESRQSFPFPRVAGKWFRYNEFVLVARKV